MFNPDRVVSVAAESDKRAKDRERERYEARVRFVADKMDALIRNILPRTLQSIKGDDLRKPYPEPRQLFSDTLRGHAKPAHHFGEFLGRLIASGMTHQDARFFAAKVMQCVDEIYADQVPQVQALAPQLAKEAGEALSELMTANRDPSTVNLERALDEVRELEVCAAITSNRIAQDRNQKHQLHNIAVTRLTTR